MKKKLYSSICLWCFVIIALCACGKQKQGNPIVLPNKEEIISISVSDGEKIKLSPNTEGESDAFISEFLSLLMDMEITNKASITDAPTNKNYITINLYCDDKTTTLFYYKDKDAEYVEQPYQGIYKPAPDLGLYIMEMLDSADRILMVKINDKLYYGTGKESSAVGRCGNMDGQVTSTVDGSEIPTENNQSNFGTGFGYQYGADDTIEIYMNEKWYVFEYREE